MRLSTVVVLLCLAGALPCVFAEEAKVDLAPAASSNQFVVALIDGSRLVCTPLVKAIPLKTSFANVDIPFERIDTVTFDKERKEASVKLGNGDQIRGEILLESLKIRTVLGDFSIALSNVQEIKGSPSEKAGAKKFSDSPAKRAQCVNNLRMIDAAKEQWAMASSTSDGVAVDIAGMVQYLKGSAMPKCLAGGTYKVNVTGKTPECTVPGHTMPTME